MAHPPRRATPRPASLRHHDRRPHAVRGRRAAPDHPHQGDDRLVRRRRAWSPGPRRSPSRSPRPGSGGWSIAAARRPCCASPRAVHRGDRDVRAAAGRRATGPADRVRRDRRRGDAADRRLHADALPHAAGGRRAASRLRARVRGARAHLHRRPGPDARDRRDRRHGDRADRGRRRALRRDARLLGDAREPRLARRRRRRGAAARRGAALPRPADDRDRRRPRRSDVRRRRGRGRRRLPGRRRQGRHRRAARGLGPGLDARRNCRRSRRARPPTRRAGSRCCSRRWASATSRWSRSPRPPRSRRSCSSPAPPSRRCSEPPTPSSTASRPPAARPRPSPG